MSGNVSILMQFGDVQGDSNDSAHKNWVKLNSCHFDVTRNITQESGNPKRNTGSPTISTITITKVMDPATPGILLEALSGTGQDCTIHFAQGSDGETLKV